MSDKKLKVTSTYTTEQAKYKALFDLICDDENWKRPIHCVIPRWAFNEYDEACKYFTGGALEVINVKEKDCTFRGFDLLECKSEGYYNHIGA